MLVGDFLRAQDVGRPWNCSTEPADWCVALGHPDFAARWRAIVREDECEAVPVAAGGLVELWHEGIGQALPLADPPYRAGDIAVVQVAGLTAGAIFTGERWAIRKRRGHFIVSPDMVRIIEAWRP